MVSIEIRKKIEKHLTLSNKLQIAAKEVLENGNLSITEDVTTKYGLEYHILSRKVNIMKRKKEFYERKRRLDAVRKKIMEGKSTYIDVSKKYGIHKMTIFHEVYTARVQENYEFDRRIRFNSNIFTYLQEESLLKILKDWARSESSQDSCSCTFCALEQLLTLAYEFARQNNIKCPVWDIDRETPIGWLIDFKMRHSDEITNSFYSFDTVLKQIIG